MSMRFLFVSAFVRDDDSGAAGSLLAIANALEALGHSVDLEWRSLKPYRIKHPTAATLLELPGRQWRQVAARLAASHYDVVIISQPYAFRVYQEIAPRYPATLFLNRTHGWEARLFDAEQRLGWERRGPWREALSRLARAAVRNACLRSATKSHGIIASSSLCARYICATYGLDSARVAWIAHGVNGVTAGGGRVTAPGLRFLYVGNYLPAKGSQILENLLPRLARDEPKFFMTFVVDPAARARVEQVYRLAFGERLTVHAWAPRDRLQQIYRSHDVLIFPSLFEGFGKVFLEGMAHGLCVVGFAEGGLPDLARAGEEALYCAPGDQDNLANFVRSVIDHPEVAHTMGNRARERARTFSWERAARETVTFCQARRKALLST